MRRVLFVATVTRHINAFHIPYLKWFKEHGYEVHVASNGNENIEYCDKHYNLEFARFPIKMQNVKVYKELKEIINNNKYDIIHCHTPVGGVLTRMTAKKARKKYNTKVIYTAHGFHFYNGAPILNWVIYYPIEKHLSKYTDCLITINSEDYKKAKNKFKAKNIKLINGVGVDENKFNFKIENEEKNKIKSTLNINDNDFIMIYPAELSKRKNQGMLLNAIKILKDEGYNNVKLLLPGLDSMQGKYQEKAKELDIEKQILFLGYRKDIPELMKISDIAVSTARQEGLPVNLLEAMMCELPIIATDCRGNRDLVETNRNGYIVKQDDVKELSERIKEFINNREKIVEFGKNGRQKVCIYELNTVINDIEQIYNTIGS